MVTIEQNTQKFFSQGVLNSNSKEQRETSRSDEQIWAKVVTTNWETEITFLLLLVGLPGTEIVTVGQTLNGLFFTHSK